MSTDIIKGRYWAAILYPESMVDDWQSRIGDCCQNPIAYIVHDKDLVNDPDEPRKIHVHCLIAFPNTTTIKFAAASFKRLDKDSNHVALGRIEPVFNIQGMFNYLIHDTDECRACGKHLYDPSERILKNNFDIGAYIQISLEEKLEKFESLANLIVDENIEELNQLYKIVRDVFDITYMEIFRNSNAVFARMCNSNRFNNKHFQFSLVHAADHVADDCSSFPEP